MANPEQDAHRIGENVRRARRYRGMSLEILAGLVGRSGGWISNVENGRTRLERRTDIAALAEALQVSADDLLGEPASEIQPEMRTVNLAPLRDVLLDASPDDPPDLLARPIEVLHAEVYEADTALRNSDHATTVRLLASTIGELCVHAATGNGPDRAAALRLLVRAYGSDGTCLLRQMGQTSLAWIAGERGWQSAELLGDPIWRGAAAFGRAHARSSANRPKGLLVTPRVADDIEPHIGDDRFGQEAYGMIRLSAALAAEVEGDHRSARDHLKDAARLAQRVGEQPDAWELFGPANVGVWSTTLAVEAAEPEEALTHAAGVNQRVLPSRNRRAGLRLEMARAHAMLDHDAVAISELRVAERLSPVQTHNNPLVRELVTDLLSRARREAGGRDLRGLAWRMSII